MLTGWNATEQRNSGKPNDKLAAAAEKSAVVQARLMWGRLVHPHRNVEQVAAMNLPVADY